MKLEPGMVNQVAALVEGWDISVLYDTMGHFTASEADLLARVFAAHGGMEDGVKVMAAFMEATLGDGGEDDWAGDAVQVSEMGWLDDAALWDETVAIWAEPGATHARMLELVEIGNRNDEDFRVQQIRGV